MYELKYKVILIGDVQVGKTSFLYSATNKSQNNIQPTMGVDMITTTIILHGKQLKVQMWDTTGSEKYKSITNSYYKKAQGVILMFDINNYKSFQNIKSWNNQVDKKTKSKTPKVLVANKLDLVDKGTTQRKVSQEQITNFCIQNQMTYRQASALKGINIKQSIHELVEKMHQSRFEQNAQKQITSFFTINQNTTILEPPIINDIQSGYCSKCC